jgi:hypothetical protein
MHYIPILSTLITLAFALVVFRRYSERGGTHLLLWGVGLVFYGLGTFGEAVMLFTYSEWILKLWYLMGAMLTAAWLGQGSIHLLVRRKGVAPSLSVILGIVSLIATGLIAAAPVTSTAFDIHNPASAQYHDILVRSSIIIIMTILLNIYGTIGLVGGALYSAFLFWRKNVLANRMYGNILIAAGALMPAMGGTFIKVGLPDWLYMSEFLGALLMFAGFITATSQQPVKEKKQIVAKA